jgi:tRNA-(ms[2]io[6]A)-hydroxylase
MLHLKSESTTRWLSQVDQNLDEILIDHAHCERKAASTAMNLMNAYTDNRAICREMTIVIQEELEHFHMVVEILDQRKIPFRRIAGGSYGRKLNALVRPGPPDRDVDRMLIASLIEARSCERFSLLAAHVKDRDAELSAFYAGLFESEARHHTTYVRLAEEFAPREIVRARLNQLSQQESEIISAGSELPRMHS